VVKDLQLDAFQADPSSQRDYWLPMRCVVSVHDAGLPLSRTTRWKSSSSTILRMPPAKLSRETSSYQKNNIAIMARTCAGEGKGNNMPNEDQIRGKARELGGSAQEKAGEATGNEDLEHRGAATKGKGKVQGAVGNVKEKADDLKDKVTGH
jgi:uncharacterized protein YjbJ (UPF0337 family)